jgi:PAS domain S-box-containing protein
VELALDELQPLSDDGQFAVYRARWHGDPVLAVALVASEPTTGSIARLQYEYSLADVLDRDWAAVPLELGSYKGIAALVLQDDDSEPLVRILGQPLDTARILHLAIGMAAALGQVHRRGLIHKDIKPANVLVDPRGKVRLTGFGIASKLRREHQSPAPLEVIAGTLAYMAPEQTGRMNRSIDTRSDLYSLGVILYEMLTGTLPFTATDPITWVHSHVARQAIPPVERVDAISIQISRIVMKLLAKTGEERYQTVEGLEADLERCLVEWETRGQIELFRLAMHDVPRQLVIPEKLYGREREIATLLASFDRVVTSGNAEFVLLSGYSGVGKTSVVNELHKVLLASRGNFASGKFESLRRDVPYATFAKAFQTLVRQILTRPETAVDEWRRDLRAAMGSNGQLIVNLIPELELVIGKQAPVMELPPRDERARLQTVFRRFLGVFARSDRPLALFLDDLQSADTSTLDLIVHLMTHNDVRHLLLVGAYRDNEVTQFHPLLQACDAIRDANGQISHIPLEPLPRAAVRRLVADALHCDERTARPLAELIHEKTNGNPFFTIQFLVMLADEELLAFDLERAKWTWRLRGIRAKGFSDNAADLMAAKLSRLPGNTRNALRQLACLGNAANGSILALMNGVSERELRATLREALSAGLVVDTDGTYGFIHDRVHEAAYALVAEADRPSMHLSIGRLLATRFVPGEREEAIFDIANQFNRGIELLLAPEERQRVAEFNLIAGRRAKASTAYESALTYLSTGDALLPDDRWTHCYELAFALGRTWAECDQLSGNLALAENRLSMLSRQVRDLADDAAITCSRVRVHAELEQYGRAIEVALEFLRKVDVDWLLPVSEENARLEYQRLFDRLGSHPIEALVRLPPMADPVCRATMDVLTRISRPALFADQNLLRLAIGRMGNLSLEHGNSAVSGYAYVWIGVVLAGYFDDYEAAFRFGKAGLDLSERPEYRQYSFRANNYLDFANRIAPWTQHLRTCRPWLQSSFKAAQDGGETIYAAYSRSALISNLLASGEPLGDVRREAETWLEFTRRAHVDLTRDLLLVQLSFIATLRSRTLDSAVADGLPPDEHHELLLEGNPRPPVVMCSYWISKLQSRYHAGDVAGADEAASRAEPLLWTLPSHVELADYHFYAALSRAAPREALSAGQRSRHGEMVTAHHARLAIWAKSCPGNFASQAALVSAEIARIEGRELDAMRLYEEAIQLAREHGFIQNEAVANELAAAFHAGRGLSTIANAYLAAARYCYLRWGADRKVRQLDELYPQLRPQPTLFVPTASTGTRIEELDVRAMLKASQAISGEIVLGSLIETLMRTVVEHAGAERGVLILLRNGEPQVAAEAITNQGPVEVRLREATVSNSDLPEPAFHYVMRTRESLVLDDASTSDLLADNSYVRDRDPKSVLCLPITRQANMVGVLYLENSLSPRVFTADRVSVLEFLAAQAAISLDNTYLYSDLQRSEAFLADGQRMSRTGTWRWSLSTGKLQWSDEHCRIFGYDPAGKDRLTIESFLARVHPADLTEIQQRIDTATKNSADFAVDFRLALPDGSVKYVHGLGRPIVDAAGSAREFVGTTIDITQRKLGEDALRNAQADLARAGRLATMGELTALIGHEVSQPLMAIVTNADACVAWLTNTAPNLDEARRAAERIIGNGHRAAAIIKGIRSLARKAEPEMVPFDINDAIGEILALIGGELRRQNVSLETELSGDVGLVAGDRVQLQQVVLNLIMNGIEAMNAVTQRPRTLWIRSRPEPSGVLVAVADVGTGLDPATADRIFDGFFTTKPEGIGMGLAISRTIIEAHGGELWASTNQPHGSIFQFTMPGAVAGKGYGDAA